MTSDLHKLDFESSLLNYNADNQVEQQFRLRMQELLKYPNCFERSLLHAHFTGSAWVVDLDHKKALLTHHAKLNRWLQLGGHADGDSNMPRVAAKELCEESGRNDFELTSEEIFDIDIHIIPAKRDVPEHEHYDVRYLFLGDSTLPLQKNHESNELAWVDFEALADKVDANDSIMRMLNKTLKKIDQM